MDYLGDRISSKCMAVELQLQLMQNYVICINNKLLRNSTIGLIKKLFISEERSLQQYVCKFRYCLQEMR